MKVFDRQPPRNARRIGGKRNPRYRTVLSLELLERRDLMSADASFLGIDVASDRVAEN